jgi:hypothetical protein
LGDEKTQGKSAFLIGAIPTSQIEQKRRREHEQKRAEYRQKQNYQNIAAAI